MIEKFKTKTIINASSIFGGADIIIVDDILIINETEEKDILIEDTVEL